MTGLSTLPLSLILSLSFLGGSLIGYAYFRSLRKTADLIVNRGHPLLAAALTLGRLGLISGGLYCAALYGGFALLTTLAGVLCAKTLLLRQPNGAVA